MGMRVMGMLAQVQCERRQTSRHVLELRYLMQTL